MQDDMALHSLDMERSYEDPSWGLDHVNSELQHLSDDIVESQIEAAYDEMLDSIMNLYYPENEEFDF